MNTLKAAMGGDPDARLAIFEEPLRAHIATVLEENGTWQMAMFEKLQDNDGVNENNRSNHLVFLFSLYKM